MERDWKEYHRKYNIERYHRRRAEFIATLGGKCAKCGSVENLEIDHIDRSTKLMDVGKMLSFSLQTSLDELKKCQALCSKCHLEKTISESSVPHGGGLTGKRNCYCELCAPLKRAYMRQFKRKKKIAALAQR